MKRKIFAAFAALLAFMLATCDLIEPPSAAKAESPKSTPDGRPLVQLSINVGNNAVNKSVSRALTSNTATKNAVNYYEVAFKDPDPRGNGKVYRNSWTEASTDPDKAKISVPVGIYADDTYAVLFAGHKNGSDEPVLLAVGRITATSEGDGELEIIKDVTTSVTFTLLALTNSVSTDKDNSTFKIIGPPAYKTETLTTLIIPSETIETESKTVPVFKLPARGHINMNDFDHTQSYSGNDIVGHYKVINSNFGGVALARTWGFTSSAVASTRDSIYDIGVTVIIRASYPDNTSGLYSPIDGDFYFYIDLPAGAGGNSFSKIYIDVPVYAISNNADHTAPNFWHIYGGTDNETLDEGTNTTGGAVLLFVPYSSEEQEVESGGDSSSMSG